MHAHIRPLIEQLRRLGVLKGAPTLDASPSYWPATVSTRKPFRITSHDSKDDSKHADTTQNSSAMSIDDDLNDSLSHSLPLLEYLKRGEEKYIEMINHNAERTRK